MHSVLAPALHRMTLVTALAATFAMQVGPAAAADPAVITLTQTACQFVESENGVDHGFTTAAKANCERENDRSGEARLAKARPLVLEAGQYVFRVTNTDVPYELGFFLRGEGIVNRLRLPKISGGGLFEGKSRDYVVDLEPGEYIYSCPLNTTPDYKLVVRG